MYSMCLHLMSVDLEPSKVSGNEELNMLAMNGVERILDKNTHGRSALNSFMCVNPEVVALSRRSP